VLADAVSRSVGAPVTHIGDVHRHELAYDAFLAGRSVTRLRGVALTSDGPVEWSLVEKLTAGPADVSDYLYANGRRELLAYGSDLLSDLAPAVSAPLAYGLDQGPDGRLTLLLEDLSPSGRRMSPPDVRLAAQHLGRLAGRWLGRVPRHPWLFTGWIERHAQSPAMAGALQSFRSLRSRRDIESRLGWRIDEAADLIRQQTRLASALERMPQTLCHHDAVAANVFVRSAGGQEELVLIDWESIGPGAVGADLASLLFSSARRGDSSATVLPALIPAALEAYGEGMRETGAYLGEDALRLMVHAAIALRWTLTRDLVVALENGSFVRRGSAPEESADAALTQLIALSRVLLDSGEEARRLSARSS
jgi:hypothetical protein